jgi:NAD(P)-dependent dehydrogenase (short-subunit alcohol dehydrogenase family)
MKVVVTGANRGIGLELARQCLARGDSVHAGVRVPARAEALAALGPLVGRGARLVIEALDVADEGSVRAFAAGLAAQSEPIDVLVNNAGVRTRADDLEGLDLEEAARMIAVNALGPLRVTRALLPLLRRGDAADPGTAVAKVVHLGSALGAIEGNTSGGAYGYRMSKAASNMAARSLSHDLRAERIVVAVISPGWVRTDMGGEDAPTSVEESAAGVLAAIDGLTLEDSGAFLDFRGVRIPW